MDIVESGWDEGGNCVKCGETGRCCCRNHYVKSPVKGVLIRRVPSNTMMFAKYYKGDTLYHAFGARRDMVGSLTWIISQLVDRHL